MCEEVLKVMGFSALPACYWHLNDKTPLRLMCELGERRVAYACINACECMFISLYFMRACRMSKYALLDEKRLEQILLVGFGLNEYPYYYYYYYCYDDDYYY